MDRLLNGTNLRVWVKMLFLIFMMRERVKALRDVFYFQLNYLFIL